MSVEIHTTTKMNVDLLTVKFHNQLNLKLDPVQLQSDKLSQLNGLLKNAQCVKQQEKKDDLVLEACTKMLLQCLAFIDQLLQIVLVVSVVLKIPPPD
jgi:hypothetical protein